MLEESEFRWIWIRGIRTFRSEAAVGLPLSPFRAVLPLVVLFPRVPPFWAVLLLAHFDQKGGRYEVCKICGKGGWCGRDNVMSFMSCASRFSGGDFDVAAGQEFGVHGLEADAVSIAAGGVASVGDQCIHQLLGNRCPSEPIFTGDA